MKFFLTVIFLQLLIIGNIPIAADEAYFVAWGKQLSWIYYDHPPMTGWVSWILNQISSVGYAHRLFSLLLGLFSAYNIYLFIKWKQGADLAGKISTLFITLPINILLFSIFVNDTLLYFFLLIFIISFHKSLVTASSTKKSSWGYAFSAGLMLGCALLTKFTAIIFFATLSLYLLINIKRYFHFLLRQYIVIGLLALSVFSINIIANYNNCGINLAFNFIFRDSQPGISGVWEFIASFVVLIGPAVYFSRPRQLNSSRLIKLFFSTEYFFTGVFLITTIALLLIAVLRGAFGLHWGAPIVLFAIFAIAEHAEKLELKKITHWNIIISLIFYLPFIFFIILLNTNNTLATQLLSERNHFHANRIHDLADGSIIQSIKQEHAGKLISSPSYGIISMLETDKDLDTALLFNIKSKFGRNHDIFKDYREYDGRDILFLPSIHTTADFNMISTYFEQAETVQLNGTYRQYPALAGKNFNFEKYRKNKIQKTLDALYKKIPPLYGSCYMDKYKPW